MTDNEINLRFDGLISNVNQRLDNQDQALMRIEKVVGETKDQASKTNGMVASIKEWKSFMQGAIWAFTGFLTLVVIPMLGYALYAITTMNERINTEVQKQIQVKSLNINDG